LRKLNHSITDDYTKADVFLLTLYRDENQNIKISYWWKLVEDYGLSSEDRNYFTGLIEKDFETIKGMDIDSGNNELQNL
jgi:hypothetical protein